LNFSYEKKIHFNNIYLIYKIFKLNLKNIIVYLKYLNLVKFWSSRLDQIRPNSGGRKLSPIWINLGRGRLGQLRPRLVWLNLVKFWSDLTQSNLAKIWPGQLLRIQLFWLGMTKSHLARSTRLNFGLDRLSQISAKVDSTDFGHIRPYLGQCSLNQNFQSLVEVNSAKFGWI